MLSIKRGYKLLYKSQMRLEDAIAAIRELGLYAPGGTLPKPQTPKK